MVGLFDGILNVLSNNIHSPLICFISRSGFWSVSCLPPSSCVAHYSVFWRGKREMGFFGSMSHSWGNGYFLTHSHFTTWKKLLAEKSFLGTGLYCLGGGINVIKIKLFLTLSSPSYLRFFFFFFALAMCWNFPTELLDFHKSSLVCEQLFNLVFFRGSWTTAVRGWSWFMGHFRVYIWD